MGIHKCSNTNTNSKYYCQLFDGALNSSGLHPLPMSGNSSSPAVYVKSIQRPRRGVGSVCFFNVSFNNCSVIRLLKATGPDEQYRDRSNTRIPHQHKSYVKIYYGSEGDQQHQTLYEQDLATLDDVFPATSLFIAHWVKSFKSDISFHLQAQCMQ